MKMKLLFIALLSIVLTSGTFAQEKKNKKAQIMILLMVKR